MVTGLEQTLFEKYGGFSTISRIVMAFYERLLDDDDVGPYFDDVDMPKLMDHQTKFVSALMGGPASFSDAHIERAHQHLIVRDADFDRLKELVDATLSDFDLQRVDIDTVLKSFEDRRSLLVRPQNVD